VPLYGLVVTVTPLGATPPVPDALFKGDVEYWTSS
jgi:hypothetical protein